MFNFGIYACFELYTPLVNECTNPFEDRKVNKQIKTHETDAD